MGGGKQRPAAPAAPPRGVKIRRRRNSVLESGTRVASLPPGNRQGCGDEGVQGCGDEEMSAVGMQGCGNAGVRRCRHEGMQEQGDERCGVDGMQGCGEDQCRDAGARG